MTWLDNRTMALIDDNLIELFGTCFISDKFVSSNELMRLTIEELYCVDCALIARARGWDK